MGYFSNAGTAPLSMAGIYLNEGHKYLLEIADVKMITSRKGDNLFCAEFVIHESDDPKLGPGFKPSWLTNLKQDAAMGNIIVFVGAVNGIDSRDEPSLRANVTEDVLEVVVSPKNPLRGRYVQVITKNKKTKAGNDFTMHYWEPVPPGFVPPASRLTERGAAAVGVPQAPQTAAPRPPGPPAPPAPPRAPAPPIPFPPPGWTAHPTEAGWFYKGLQVVSEADLRAGRI